MHRSRWRNIRGVSIPPSRYWKSPGTRELCAQVLVQHVFGNSIDEAPVVRPYSPTPSCPVHRWSRIVLRWMASSTGRQFDRISAVWLGGVEILRTCTAEPAQQPGGIEWRVEKDVTRYSALWKRPQMVALKLANVLSAAESLTGLYDVNLSVHFYDATEATQQRTEFKNLESSSGESRFENLKPSIEAAEAPKSSGDGGGGGVEAADVILPFPSLSSDPWFHIGNDLDAHTRRFPTIPRNAYRASLEVCVSHHHHDEFWYANKPNAYSTSKNITSADFENGPFREILVTIDDLLAGVVHPFPVIYTGGVNPFFWRPVTAIGSFVLPSYDLDITPFLPRLLNPKPQPHTFTLAIPNALPFWLLGLNLHIWIDNNTSASHGALIHHSTSLTTELETLRLNPHSWGGTFQLKTSRVLSHAGWLLSSFGNLTTKVEFSAELSHAMSVADSGIAMRVRRDSITQKSLLVKSDERAMAYGHEIFRFPMRMSMRQKLVGNGAELQTAAIDHAWEEERQYQVRGEGGYGGDSFFSAMKNRQQARGRLLVPVVGNVQGVAETRQRLLYDGSGGCYSRELEVGNNGSYLFDWSHTRCT